MTAGQLVGLATTARPSAGPTARPSSRAMTSGAGFSSRRRQWRIRRSVAAGSAVRRFRYIPMWRWPRAIASIPENRAARVVHRTNGWASALRHADQAHRFFVFLFGSVCCFWHVRWSWPARSAQTNPRRGATGTRDVFSFAQRMGSGQRQGGQTAARTAFEAWGGWGGWRRPDAVRAPPRCKREGRRWRRVTRPARRSAFSCEPRRRRPVRISW